MRYTPNPPAVVAEMLQEIGMQSCEELFTDIPAPLKLQRPLDLPRGLSEIELRREMESLARKNTNLNEIPSFLGAGAYDHYIPAALEELVHRSEFYTAYTPYQAEISQGILQAIFEYQTLICRLTGMDVANASMYDGATALAEACNLAAVSTRRAKVLVPDSLHPHYLEVLRTYALSGRMEVEILPCKDGILDAALMRDKLDKQTACLAVQQPNFFGLLEEVSSLGEILHENKSLLVVAVDPISLGILKPPGEYGADVVVGEGQALGNPLSFGGPYLGFFATTAKLMRKMPGRIVGQTRDQEDQRAFVLTLQAREQHIRREKANSNICSNQALNALAATIYLCLVGAKGLRDIALRSHQLAVYASQQLESVGLEQKYQHPFFREFAVQTGDPAWANRALLENGIIGGYELADSLLLAFTEKRTREQVDRLVSILGGIKHG
jgi:glycine dehydrogenase subunit 1